MRSLCSTGGARIAQAVALSVFLTALPGASAGATRLLDDEEIRRLADRQLIEALTAATSAPSTPPARLAVRVAALEQALERIAAGVSGEGARYSRARRLDRLLRKEYLRTYSAAADDLAAVLRGGRFNCLSGTLFYGLAARSAGFRVRILEGPGHVRVRIALDGGGSIDVETTLPQGFDIEPGTASLPGHRPNPQAQPAAAAPALRSVRLERAVGFAWMNRASRALAEGHSEEAARSASEAASLLPGSETDAAAVDQLLAEAFRQAYERGCWSSSYVIARAGVRLWPLRTSTRDRLQAAALKQATGACASDDPAAAEEILRDARAALQEDSPADDGETLADLSRKVWACATAARVRRGEWCEARRAARAFAAVEPDAVEAERLARWVEERARPDQSVCLQASAQQPPTMGVDFPGPLD